MKKSFMCSLICRGGILGGGIYIERHAVTYKTNKLTVDRKYRNLVLPFSKIRQLSWKWIVFPIATFQMENGEKYKAIIFNKWRFDKWFHQMKQSEKE